MTLEEAKEQLLKHKKEIDQKYISARYSKAIETALKELDNQDTEINKLKNVIDRMAKCKGLQNRKTSC